MEKNGYKVIAVVALILAVVALSVGFASFSATLSIQNAQATVGANDTFSPKVHYKNNSLKCVVTGSDPEVEVTDKGSLVAADSIVSWQNASVTLAAPGDSVTCSAIIQNESTFTAYLNKIELSGPLTCTKTVDPTQNFTEACAAIELTVQPGATSSSNSSITATANSTTATNKTAIDGVTIAAGSEEAVSFTITYKAGTGTGGTNVVTDEPFTVTIPTVTFTANTTD